MCKNCEDVPVGVLVVAITIVQFQQELKLLEQICLVKFFRAKFHENLPSSS
jgi:hypothetical protein